MTGFSKPHDIYNFKGFDGLSILPDTVTKCALSLIFSKKELIYSSF